MANSHGSFVWYELMTTDISAAAAFYSAVTGWHMSDAGHPTMSYTLVHAGKAAVGGMMALPDETRAHGVRPSWIGYVSVDDVDAFATRVVQAGGKIHRPPADIPQVGRFAVVADPQGAAFVLFEGAPEMQPPEKTTEKSGHFGWHELMAADMEPAFAFYASLFGWVKTTAIDMGPMGTYQLFSANGAEIGGMMTKPPSVPMPFWTFYVQVESIKQAVEKIAAAGGKVVNGPHQVPGGQWIVQGLDPQGAMFALVSPVA